MRDTSRRRVLTSIAAIALLPAARRAFAQAAYPNRPIKIIAPVQPGGGVDLVARTIADRLGRALGQSIVVENQSGGGGIVGSLATARAAPDGYTLMVGYVGTHGTNPAVRKLPYDAVKDFTPIAMVGGTPNVLVVPPSLPVNTLREFIQYAKANAGKLSYGSAGPGTLTHLAMEQLKVGRRPRPRARSVSRHRPGDHRHPRRPDTGAVSRARRRAAAHQGRQDAPARGHRSEAASRCCPTCRRSRSLGYKGFDGVQWYGIVGPANLPAPIVKLLSDEINKLLANPELRERLSGEALEPMPMSPDEFGRYIRDDIARWTRVAKERNISIVD